MTYAAKLCLICFLCNCCIERSTVFFVWWWYEDKDSTGDSRLLSTVTSSTASTEQPGRIITVCNVPLFLFSLHFSIKIKRYYSFQNLHALLLIFSAAVQENKRYSFFLTVCTIGKHWLSSRVGRQCCTIYVHSHTCKSTFHRILDLFCTNITA